MRNNEDLFFKFKKAFREDYGLELNSEQVKEAAGNLVDFFYLLWKFDREDKEKAKQMEVKKDGYRIPYPRSL